MTKSGEEGTGTTASTELDNDQLSNLTRPAALSEPGEVTAKPTSPAVGGGASPTTEAKPVIGEGKTQEPASGGGGAPDPNAAYRESLQARLVGKYGDQVKVPDTLTPDKELDFLEAMLYGRVHPEALRMNQALAAGKKPEDYFREYGAVDQLLGLSDKELLTKVYTDQYGVTTERPNGIPKEAIEARVNAEEQSGKLAFEAYEAREKLREQKEKQQKEIEGFRPMVQEPIDYSDPQVKQQFKADVRAVMEPIVANGNLYGLDLGKPEFKEKLILRAEELLTPDPRTGVSEFVASLSTNDGLLRAALLFDMAKKGAINAQMAQGVKRIEEIYLNGLEMRPPATGGQATNKAAIDMSRLDSPAHLMEG